MSKWYDAKKDDIELSPDGKEIYIYIDSDEFGSIYKTIKVEDITSLLKSRFGQLRQWLNEERITDPKKMVTNEELITWLK